MKQTTGIISIFGIAALGLILVGGLCCWIPQGINNLTLRDFADNLYEYPLPPNTEIKSRFKELEKVGNGNNCYYIASQAMTSSLPREEIEEYYEDVSFPVVHKGRIDGLKEIKPRIEFEGEVSEGETHFTVELIDTGSHNTLDIRCH